MFELNKKNLEQYIKEQFGEGASLTGIGEIGSLDEQGMKGFGYGKPLLIGFDVDGEPKEAVLSVMRGDEYGHQFYWDRGAILMFQYDCGDRMEKHVRPMALGYLDKDDRLIPMQSPKEFFILNEKLEGHDYFLDLERIRKGDLQDGDLTLAKDMGAWLARVHATKHDDPKLYERRIRNLIGSSECIMGLIDNAYPQDFAMFPQQKFIELEKSLIDWRWMFKKQTNRLSAVHGDFHPWNVLVREDGDFSVLDRSRGEWGEPADDLATMAINYLLFGIYDEPRMSKQFEKLYLSYIESYLEKSQDEDILKLMGPFFVFRGLVIASPGWYPDHPDKVRQGLLNFMVNVLSEEVFDYKNINRYMD